jgi:hypothetical protein
MTASTKKPIQQSLPAALRGAINDGQQLQCQQWPCTVVSVDGAIVTVTFEVSSEFTLPQVTCPIAESRYVRLPVQEGDQGFVTAASTRLGGVTGLGSGLAPLSTPANLGGLVFVPLGNKNWTTIDPDAVVIQAPNGSKILTDDGASEIIVDTGQVKVTQGDVTVDITGGVVTITADHVIVNATDSTFNGQVDVNGSASITGTLFVEGAISSGSDISAIGSVNATSMNIIGAASVGSLTIGGKPFGSHDHLPGTYKAGSTSITGVSGGVGP